LRGLCATAGTRGASSRWPEGETEKGMTAATGSGQGKAQVAGDHFQYGRARLILCLVCGGRNPQGRWPGLFRDRSHGAGPGDDRISECLRQPCDRGAVGRFAADSSAVSSRQVCLNCIGGTEGGERLVQRGGEDHGGIGGGRSFGAGGSSWGRRRDGWRGIRRGGAASSGPAVNGTMPMGYVNLFTRSFLAVVFGAAR